MHSQVVKWVSIAALPVAVLSWIAAVKTSAANYQLELKLVVCAAAAFATALATLRPQRLIPILSITDKNPGSRLL
jgi:hypothetical protein